MEKKLKEKLIRMRKDEKKEKKFIVFLFAILVFLFLLKYTGIPIIAGRIIVVIFAIIFVLGVLINDLVREDFSYWHRIDKIREVWDDNAIIKNSKILYLALSSKALINDVLFYVITFPIILIASDFIIELGAIISTAFILIALIILILESKFASFIANHFQKKILSNLRNLE